MYDSIFILKRRRQFTFCLLKLLTNKIHLKVKKIKDTYQKTKISCMIQINLTQFISSDTNNTDQQHHDMVLSWNPAGDNRSLLNQCENFNSLYYHSYDTFMKKVLFCHFTEQQKKNTSLQEHKSNVPIVQRTGNEHVTETQLKVNRDEIEL